MSKKNNSIFVVTFKSGYNTCRRWINTMFEQHQAQVRLLPPQLPWLWQVPSGIQFSSFSYSWQNIRLELPPWGLLARLANPRSATRMDNQSKWSNKFFLLEAIFEDSSYFPLFSDFKWCLSYISNPRLINRLRGSFRHRCRMFPCSGFKNLLKTKKKLDPGGRGCPRHFPLSATLTSHSVTPQGNIRWIWPEISKKKLFQCYFQFFCWKC